MSFNSSQSASNTTFVSQHILDIIQYLMQNAQQDNDANGSNELNERQTQDHFTLLLIGQSDLVHRVTESLQQANAEIDITTLSADDFLKAPFDTRYELGCFIHSGIIFKTDSAEPDASNTSQTENPAHSSDNLQTIAIRLRDLFAQQSLMFMPSDAANLNFNGLGYTAVPLLENDHQKGTCWQFNLYDYKQRPDWLNAKYWANPENFGKYRW